MGIRLRFPPTSDDKLRDRLILAEAKIKSLQHQLGVLSAQLELQRYRKKAAKRLRKVSDQQALDWFDVALAGAWKAAEDYRKSGEDTDLLEAERGLQLALGAVDDQLRRRGLR